MGGEERVRRQHEAGRMTVRERIERLLDPGTFDEIGALAGFGQYATDGSLDAFTPANLVAGTGRIEGRHVVVCGDDFTVRGGAADASIHEKQVYAERMANELRLPLVRLVDGTGGGGSVKSHEKIGRTYVPANPGWDLVVDNLGKVPVVAACLGPVAGLGAARVVSAHFSVMVRELAQLFVAGPPVVAAGMGRTVTKEELGGWEIHTRQSGAVDNLAETEAEALDLCRRFLGYLPANVWQLPPVCAFEGPVAPVEELREIVPRSRRQPYDVRRILGLVFDAGSVFEIAPGYGRSCVTALARLGGRPVAVLASDPKVYGGGLTAAAADKMARWVDTADTFHLPVVNIVDQPGFVIGVEAEQAGTIRRGARALAAAYQATVPWVSVIVRKVFGVAGAGHGNAQALNYRFAWPSADWGSLPVEGGLEAAYRRELEASPDPETLKAEILARLDAVRSPFRTAESFNIERIIDPAETRVRLVDWAELAYEVLATRPLGPRGRPMRP